MPYWYHGTTKEASEIILKEGFRAGTYFSKEMASSLVMGGDYVFWVWFNEDPTKCWEYICPEPIGKDQITPKVLYHSEEVERRVRKQHHEEDYGKDSIFCTHCDGLGQMESHPAQSAVVLDNYGKTGKKLMTSE